MEPESPLALPAYPAVSFTSSVASVSLSVKWGDDNSDPALRGLIAVGVNLHLAQEAKHLEMFIRFLNYKVTLSPSFHTVLFERKIFLCNLLLKNGK